MTESPNSRDLPTPEDAPGDDGRVVPEPAIAADPARSKIPRSRLGDLWGAAVIFAVVLLLLLIFVLENGQRAEVSFLGIHGHLPMGVALLLAAVVGILLVALPGTARIVQLRILARRRRGHPRPATGVPSRPDRTSSPADAPHRTDS